MTKNRPTLIKSDIKNFERVSEFVQWFLINEPIVNALSNPSNNILFNEGFRPISNMVNNPEYFKTDYKSLSDWFIKKLYLDLNMLQNSNKVDFSKYIDTLDDEGKKTLIICGQISMKYDLNFESFIYDKEIIKIPEGEEREQFKQYFLEDNIIGGEIRILAWLYHEYFGEWYKVKEDR